MAISGFDAVGGVGPFFEAVAAAGSFTEAEGLPAASVCCGIKDSALSGVSDLGPGA